MPWSSLTHLCLFEARSPSAINDRYFRSTRLRLRRVAQEGEAPVYKFGQKVRPQLNDPSVVMITNVYISETEYEVLARQQGRTMQLQISPPFELSDQAVETIREMFLFNQKNGQDIAAMRLTFTETEVLNGNEKRLALSWDALDRVEYEIRYRPSYSTEPTVVNSSLTLAGGFTSVFVPGLANGGTRTVYIQPQDGFFQVAVRLRSV